MKPALDSRSLKGPRLDWLIARIAGVSEDTVSFPGSPVASPVPRLAPVDKRGERCVLSAASALFCMRDGKSWSPSRDVAWLLALMNLARNATAGDICFAPKGGNEWEVSLQSVKAMGETPMEALCRALVLLHYGEVPETSLFEPAPRP